MTNKWKTSDIEKISKGFATNLVDKVFNEKEKLSGDEIITVTDFTQINFFVLREIFNRWETDLEKFKSPYFNFESPEVQKSFSDFKNTLSRNISVGAEDFKSLVEISCKQTLELYIEPLSFFTYTFKELPEFKLRLSWLEKNKVFFKSYDWLIGALREGVSQEPEHWVYANQAIEAVKLYLDEKKDNFDTVIEEISEFAGLTTPNHIAFETEDDSFFSRLVNNQVEEKPSLNLSSVKIESPFERILSKAKVESVESPNVIPNETSKPLSESPLKPIVPNKEPQQTLNEVFLNTGGVSLAEIQQRVPIESIKGSMSLNERFAYLNTLFNHDLDSFDACLAELESKIDFESAKETLLTKYASQYNWDLKGEDYLNFISLVRRKFN